MSNDLAARACTACRKDTPKLDAAAIQDLSSQLADWSLRDNDTRIERAYAFDDFASAFAFVSRVAAIAEDADHHPDIAFGWGYARLSFSTHSIGGLHENDFILAARCDRMVSER
ncbi:4a-hydroxytetrahydrobiopterin dehydratase [Lichenicoccus sp.]|uniref:4a-hydroxytetrahydrobiopterin dehydratase n=1 Tax=Lichenicoccus sp. TaxID=2781899 RepID=UPI003D13DC2B